MTSSANNLSTGAKSLHSSLRDGRRAGPQHQKGFAAETAETSGRSIRSIQQKLARAEKVVVLKEIAGTSLDKGVELDALAKLPDDQQRELARRASAGEQVSARDTGAASTPTQWRRHAAQLVENRPNDDALFWLIETIDFTVLMNAWNKAGPEARDRFRDAIAAEKGQR